MARKNILEPYKMFDSVDISQTETSHIVNIKNMDKASIILEWTGSSPVGTIDVQVRNIKEPVGPVTSWISLDMGATINITGASGNHILRFDELPFSEVRLVYTSVSGTGSLTATVTAKQIGG